MLQTDQITEIVFNYPLKYHRYGDADMLTIKTIEGEPFTITILVPTRIIQWGAENILSLDGGFSYKNPYGVEKYKCGINGYTIINNLIDILSNRSIYISDEVRSECIKSFYEYKKSMVEYDNLSNHWCNKFNTMKSQIIKREKDNERIRRNSL